MRVLYTSPIIEHPPAGGPQLRVVNSIKALSRVSDLHVVSRVRRGNLGGPAGEEFLRRTAAGFGYAPSAHPLRSNSLMRAARARLPLLARTETMRDARALVGKIDRLGADVLWFGYGNISFELMRAVRAARPDLKLVCDTDSVWSRFVLRELPYVTDATRRREIEILGREKELEERDWTDFCDVTTGVSEVDVEYYRSIAREPRKVHQFSNVLDLSNYREIKGADPTSRPVLYLAGTFGHADSPMDVGARWIVDEVLPLVRREIPDAHLFIVGIRSDLTLGHLQGPSITVTGKVPSVLPYLAEASVSLVPLRFESGTRFKILEAAACGVPVVSTTLGAEGLPVRDGEHLLIADSPEDFARSIVSLIRDRTLARRISASSRALVEHGFSLVRLESEARTILDFLEC